MLSQENRLKKRVNARLEPFTTASAWQVVLLVTCVEAYLEDILCHAAAADPVLMATSEQRAAYEEILRAASIDELVGELRGPVGLQEISRGPTRWTRVSEDGSTLPEQLGYAAGADLGIVACDRASCRYCDGRSCQATSEPRGSSSQRVTVSARQFERHLRAVLTFSRTLQASFPKLPIVKRPGGELSMK
jgi:hypothetical protein